MDLARWWMVVTGVEMQTTSGRPEVAISDLSNVLFQTNLSHLLSRIVQRQHTPALQVGGSTDTL